MSWQYKQSSGLLSSPDNSFGEMGYAGGDQGKFPLGVNNPFYQNQHNLGPLPQGIYHMGAAYDHPRLGAFVIPLFPHPENSMFGRTGFFIHGDKIGAVGIHMASDGCIIVSRSTRELINNSTDKELQVVA